MSTTTGGWLFLESGLEHELATWLDRERDVTWLVGQPVLLRWEDGTKHFPDVLSAHRDGSVTIWDVRAPEERDDTFLRALSLQWIDSIPDAPADPSLAAQELRAWVTHRFAGTEPGGVAHGLVNLIDDLTDSGLRDLLAQGWAKEIRYIASLIEAQRLPGVRDSAGAAALLFDALNGAMLRGAAHAAPSAPLLTLDYLMEAWT